MDIRVKRRLDKIDDTISYIIRNHYSGVCVYTGRRTNWGDFENYKNLVFTCGVNLIKKQYFIGIDDLSFKPIENELKNYILNNHYESMFREYTKSIGVNVNK